ncbi:hypothetical protein P43SY_011683 [Pythium insidiosum]|uniref:Uncharacterized protein n=1 Tax=Pythium insidiosum TaxID=114742 RepID=A0AAD5L6R4_PYTIN|nr:hypothetical protein P43SY_011683 [Pythium insidiosum]
MAAFGVAMETGWDLVAVMLAATVVPIGYMVIESRLTGGSTREEDLKKRLTAHVDQALRHPLSSRAATSTILKITDSLQQQMRALEGLAMVSRARFVASMVTMSTPLAAALWYAASQSGNHATCAGDAADHWSCGAGRRLVIVCQALMWIFSSVSSIQIPSDEDETTSDERPSTEDSKMALARKDEVVAWLRPQLQVDAKRIALHQQWLLTLTPETAADAKSSMLQMVVG